MIKTEKGRILVDYKRIRAVFPSSLLSNTHKYLLIKGIKLPKKFNLRTTHLLIELHPESAYRAPEAYVDRRLRIHGRRSNHLDEALTEEEMLHKGWVKLCVLANWHPNFSLVDYVIMAIKFLEGLKD